MPLGEAALFWLCYTNGNLYQSGNATYGAQETVNGKTLNGMLLGLDSPQAGDKVSGVVVFEIPQNAKADALVYNYDFTHNVRATL
jgi:hypothetical protein